MKLIFRGKILHCIEVVNLSASFPFLKEEWLTRCTLFFIQKSQLFEEVRI